MEDFFARLDAMVAELRRHPYLVVKAYRKHPPASPEAWAQVEARYPQLAVPLLRALYGQHDGCYLYWTFDADQPEDELAGIFSNYCESFEVCWPEDETDWKPFACIQLASCAQLLAATGVERLELAETPALINEVTGQAPVPDEVAGALLPFDQPGGDLHACFVLLPGLDGPLVSLFESHTSRWSGRRVSDLATYLSLLLETRGMVEARQRFYFHDDLTDLPVVRGWEPHGFQTLRPRLFDDWWIPRDAVPPADGAP